MDTLTLHLILAAEVRERIAAVQDVPGPFGGTLSSMFGSANTPEARYEPVDLDVAQALRHLAQKSVDVTSPGQLHGLAVEIADRYINPRPREVDVHADFNIESDDGRALAHLVKARKGCLNRQDTSLEFTVMDGDDINGAGSPPEFIGKRVAVAMDPQVAREMFPKTDPPEVA